MEMVMGKRYQITKRIKLHTKPNIFANVIVEGTYKHETDKFYFFNRFRVKKENVIAIKE